MNASAAPLTRAQMEILEFERAAWFSLGRRDHAILMRFGHSPTRHTQLVQHIITLPAAAEYDPLLVRRLIALRDKRRGGRARRLT